MGRKGKVIILTFVIVALLVILAKPFLFSTQNAFAVTSQPHQAYEQAISKGEPIFLKFYASW